MQNNMVRETRKSLERTEVESVAPSAIRTIRKSFAQNRAGAGTPPRTLVRLPRHTNNRIMLQFYDRVTDANERAAPKALNEVLAVAAFGRIVRGHPHSWFITVGLSLETPIELGPSAHMLRESAFADLDMGPREDGMPTDSAIRMPHARHSSFVYRAPAQDLGGLLGRRERGSSCCASILPSQVHVMTGRRNLLAGAMFL